MFDLGGGLEVTGHPSELVRRLAVATLAAALRDASMAARLVADAPEAACEILARLLTAGRAEEPAKPAARAKGTASVESVMAALGVSTVLPRA